MDFIVNWSYLRNKNYDVIGENQCDWFNWIDNGKVKLKVVFFVIPISFMILHIEFAYASFNAKNLVVVNIFVMTQQIDRVRILEWCEPFLHGVDQYQLKAYTSHNNL